MITIYFRGSEDANNWHGQICRMYAGLEDTNGVYSEVGYGNAQGEEVNDINIPEWQRWNIPLSDFTDFNDIDLEDINSMFIGFGDRLNPGTGPLGIGQVFIDEIRLYPSICIPPAPSADVTGDCVVNYDDLDVMCSHWLQIGDPLPDLYGDGIIDLKDFALLAEDWLEDSLLP